jgi:hypothetical protein
MSIHIVLALSICHRLVQMCWSTLLGTLTPMLTKNHPMDSDVTSSNLILTNTISEKLIETHELVFQGLKLVFRLAVLVGKSKQWQRKSRQQPVCLLKDCRTMLVMYFIVLSVRSSKDG